MRAFVALEVPEREVIDSIVAFQGELAATGADLKLVERENLHFTVKFLGEITEDQARRADGLLKGVSSPAAEVEVKGAGAFPSARRPSVVWVGVGREDEAKVSKIAGEVISRLAGIGEADDRPFRAHLTVGRVRGPRNAGPMISMIERDAGRPFGRAKLTTLRLKSSVLSSSGPTYSDLGVYALP